MRDTTASDHRSEDKGHMAKDEGNGVIEGYDWGRFHGYEVPRYTQVPDALFDEQLAHLGHAELKVLLWIIRKTFGYGKASDAISLSQLEKGTGLSSRSVREAVKGLSDKGAIWVHRDETARGDSAVNTYGLNVVGGGGVSTPGWGSKYPHKIQPLKKQRTTESESAPKIAYPANQPASANSDSDFLETIRQTTTTLNCPKDAKQLITLAQSEGWTATVIQAAGRVVGEALANGADIRKPGAYLTTTIRVMMADCRQAAEVGKRRVVDRRQDALAYARQVYADPIIGGNWRQVESILRESYGMELAAEVVKGLG